jgi:molecular chaperone Hsp33
MMEDYLIRAIATEVRVRAIACTTTELVKEGVRRHSASPTATVALGQALTGAALMGSLLKMRQRVAIKWGGHDPQQKILVESKSNGRIRGYVSGLEIEDFLEQRQLDLPALLGPDSLLTVVKDLRLEELVKGAVSLPAGDVGDSLTFYLNQSEQVPSLVVTSVQLAEDGSLAAAGGLLFQALPGYEGELLEQLRERLQEMPPLAALLNSGQSPEDVLAAVFGDVPFKVLAERPLAFECSCSYERIEQALIMLGREEIASILETEGQAVIDCQFCHEQYVVDRESLELLLARFDS